MQRHGKIIKKVKQPCIPRTLAIAYGSLVWARNILLTGYGILERIPCNYVRNVSSPSNPSTEYRIYQLSRYVFYIQILILELAYICLFFAIYFGVCCSSHGRQQYYFFSSCGWTRSATCTQDGALVLQTFLLPSQSESLIKTFAFEPSVSVSFS